MLVFLYIITYDTQA